MSVPTKSAISALPPPGAQRKKAGAVRPLLAGDAVAAVPVPAVPVPIVPEVAVVPVPIVPVPVVLESARAEGWMLETLTLGGVASDMMLVEGFSGKNADGGATLTAPELVAVVVVAVEPVATALVAVGVEVVLGAGGVVGKGIAPEIDAGWVPGGDGGRVAVVVVDVVVDVEVDADCASAGLAAPRSSAVASARLARFSAICYSLENTRNKKTAARHRGRARNATALGAFSRQETVGFDGAANHIDDPAKSPTRSREPVGGEAAVFPWRLGALAVQNF